VSPTLSRAYGTEAGVSDGAEDEVSDGEVSYSSEVEVICDFELRTGT
jgi:hypothetical protein